MTAHDAVPGDLPIPPRRGRLRDYGIAPGILAPGPRNAITDVAGVLVGQETLIAGDRVRTGVTAILPHGGNPFRDKVPAGLAIANGFGKFAGATQIDALGEIETPIILTSTLCVGRASEALIDWTLAQPGNGRAVSVNPIVGETNDGRLNDIRARAVTIDHVRAALDRATGEAVEEGAVGAGTGTVCFGWKGGIGTASRRLPGRFGGFTLGVLVQSNYGGLLQVDGRRVGEELGQYYLQELKDNGDADGSIMMVIATDAPLGPLALKRLADRAAAGLARTGSSFANGSGDYALAFSTAETVRRTPARRARLSPIAELPNDGLSPLFQAAIEATEEAICNSLFMARDMDGFDSRSCRRHTIRALPLDWLRDHPRASSPREDHSR